MGGNCEGLARKVLEFTGSSMFIFLIFNLIASPDYNILLLFDIVSINEFFFLDFTGLLLWGNKKETRR